MYKFKVPPRMFARLHDNRNAILTFSVGSGGFTIDPDTGNRVPSSPQSISIECIVHSIKRPDDATQQFFPGKDQQAQWFRGRSLDPKLFPSAIKHLSRGKMRLGSFNGDGIFTLDKQGDFILYNPQLNPYVEDQLGTKFFGVFLSA